MRRLIHILTQAISIVAPAEIREALLGDIEEKYGNKDRSSGPYYNRVRDLFFSLLSLAWMRVRQIANAETSKSLAVFGIFVLLAVSWEVGVVRPNAWRATALIIELSWTTPPIAWIAVNTVIHLLGCALAGATVLNLARSFRLLGGWKLIVGTATLLSALPLYYLMNPLPADFIEFRLIQFFAVWVWVGIWFTRKQSSTGERRGCA